VAGLVGGDPSAFVSVADTPASLAMGEIIRRWPFDGGNGYPSFSLTIVEPSLTGDCLGFKTWGSSYLLAQMLRSFASTSLSHLFSHDQEASKASVLELGSGTGLLGLAAASIWQTKVALSDLPSIMPNLTSNVERNRGTVESLGGTVQAGALTWGGGDDEIDQELFQKKHLFNVGRPRQLRKVTPADSPT